MVDSESILPLYYQIVEDIRDRITRGKWKSGDLIPSETQLCQQCGVSRGTVRQAVSQLVHEGLLHKKQGKGTFVAKPKINQAVNQFYSFAEDMISRGLEPSIKIIRKISAVAHEGTRHILGLEKGKRVYVIRRLCLASGDPVMLETSHLVEEMFPGINNEKFVSPSASLYDHLIDRYGLVITKAKESFEATRIGEYEARFLSIQVGSPALLVRRVCFSYDQAFEFRISVVRGDRCIYSIELPKKSATIPNAKIGARIAEPLS